MVLMKMLEKLSSRSEPDKSNSWKQQKQDEGHGGGDTKKKLKKMKSINTPKKTDHLQLRKSLQQGTVETPNYMKSTSSYDARKEKNKVKNSSLKLYRSSMRKNKGKNLQPSKDTCSSIIKDSKTNENHDALALNICNYSYCSLHGHKHGAVPSLKRFLSTRRHSLKGGKEIELVEDVVNELFIEIHSKLEEWGEEGKSDEIEIKNIVNRMNKIKLEDLNYASHHQESCSVTSFGDCGDKNSELSMEDIQVINQFLEFIEKGCQEETHSETEKSKQAENGSIIFVNDSVEEVNLSENEQLQANIVLPHPPQGSVGEDCATTLEAGYGEQKEDMSKANLINFAVENNVKDCSTLVSWSKVKYNKLRRQRTKSRGNVKEFTLHVEPEQEQVSLKHHTVDERKAAEEWMMDFALRKALRRLTSSRKKVPLLVAAFETLMPHM